MIISSSISCPGVGSSYGQDVADALTARALERQLSVIEKENALSASQHKALAYMLQSMAYQACGLDTGRYAYGLPCGGGKTQGAVALIAAAHDLSLAMTFAVATSQVEALCSIKRQLVHHGIPEQDIALWHSLKVAEVTGPGIASMPPTPPEDDRRILLLSQEKIKRGSLLWFQGRPRSLLIWDESLIATAATNVPVHDIGMALGVAQRCCSALAQPLEKVHNVVKEELDALRDDPSRQPELLHGILSGAEVAAMRDAMQSAPTWDRYSQAMRETAGCVIRLLERPVSVADTGSGARGGGVLHARVTVPPELANIAILDASHTLRALTRADKSIVDRTSAEMQNYRTYRNVKVRLVKMKTGKQHMVSGDEASLPAAREIAGAVAAAPTNEGVLIFTFKDALARLRRNLERAGVDLAQQITVNAVHVQRIQFLSWGQETSRNDMRHCRLVIMAGVLRRDALDIAASLTAQQQERPPRRNSRSAVMEVLHAEMAHCVLQGMHRGACRVTEVGGEAGRADVLILSSDVAQLRCVLDPYLPGAQWVTDASGKGQGRTSKAVGNIIKYLGRLPATEHRASISSVKKAVDVAGLGKDGLVEAVDRALNSLDGWRRDKRSLVRIPA